MKRRSCIEASGVILLVFWLLFTARPLLALEVPPLQARVNDYASILSPSTEQQLESVLRALEDEDSTQLVVLTISSLEGASLEEYSLRVVENWGIGHAGLDNGALLLIAKHDRKLRIEVGYGLEGALTDLLAGRIIRNIITPQFRNGNFDQGVIDGVSAMIGAVQGEFSEADFTSRKKHSGNDTIGFSMFLLFAVFSISRTLGKKKVLAGIAGAVTAPIVGILFFGLQWLLLLGLMVGGFLAGFLVSMLAGNIKGSRRRKTRYHSDSSGGFGGSFGGGGFSGGGGGFGGGGSSGGW